MATRSVGSTKCSDNVDGRWSKSSDNDGRHSVGSRDVGRRSRSSGNDDGRRSAGSDDDGWRSVGSSDDGHRTEGSDSDGSVSTTSGLPPELTEVLDWCGLDLDTEDHYFHGNRLRRKVCWGGRDTDRRFRGCAYECSWVDWVDAPWSRRCQRAIKGLWMLQGKTESALR